MVALAPAIGRLADAGLDERVVDQVGDREGGGHD
jgi:hypothetical protein